VYVAPSKMNEKRARAVDQAAVPSRCELTLRPCERDVADVVRAGVRVTRASFGSRRRDTSIPDAAGRIVAQIDVVKERLRAGSRGSGRRTVASPK